MFYIDNQDHMWVQWSTDLCKTHSENLFHLILECKEQLEADSYHWIVSFKLNKRREELLCDQFKWIKREILIEGDKVWHQDFQLD